ncbi:glycosyltransferase family 2 protein [Colwellia sp. MB02u-18]|uniref:glycosyltransferase family 2 protein n=1 Tax=unclassified Colwellia TaxID=196834 RepID=UPI0015F3FF61|nr:MULTISPECIES: glycosyltransferase family A protein [unclassified Colwellia]MBA6225830.1 glycosyltransferase family 2 protein [Colwellia sp. MB3u-45]MBA6267066.1 glycosyltransferase family 2 protein [Colwellia sp. MB3u-43]MBA6321990.1 glycosyltransferase family 2 protein [Colwellia sp. MB02u-19]MBA6325220.1 glycosyltransferase family 2 protein [Colwellia sp. MB02u-18]MBA6330239.1 glycosyltransferase family 2 protein [Colwellia sp. MB02u-12]
MEIRIKVHLVANLLKQTMECLMLPSISVVIPFYHAEAFFDETYQSIKQQTIQPQEIIVVNDGCGAKALDFLSQYDDIKVIDFEENKGVSTARNAGAKAATSTWIAFLDADDMWIPTKLEVQLAFLEEHPHFSACHTGVTTFDKTGDLSTFVNKPFDLTIVDLLESMQVTPPSLLITKAALEAVNYFDQKIRCSEDHELSIRLVQQGFRIGFINQALTKVRRMDHGNISSNGRTILIGHCQLLKKHWHAFRQHKGLTSKYIYKTLMTAGGKSRSLERKILFTLGKIMTLVNSNLK